MSAVLKPWIAAVKDARSQVAKEMAGVDQEIAHGYRTAPKYAKEGFGGAAKEAAKADKAIVASAEKAAKEQERAREHVYQVKQRYLAQEAAAESAAASKSKAVYASIASSAGRNFAGIVRAGAGVFGSIARGAGVNFDIGSLVGKGVGLQKSLTSISASGFMEGDTGANGKRVSVGALDKQVRNAANGAALGNDEVAEGLQRFVSKSSDLDTGSKSLGFMAKFAKSTNSDMGDVADAMGEVVNKLGDVPDKAAALQNVMMIMAKQGKLGAVEMKDQAKSLAVMVGQANKFAGSSTEAMSEMGVLFQMTKKFGGVKGPAQAATATSNFIADLTSKNGQKNMGPGIKVMSDKGHLLPLVDIMVNALKATGGDLLKGGSTFRNKRSAAVVNAFNDTYAKGESDHKGGGEAAIRAKFQEFGGAMSQSEMGESLKKAMDTDASKAQLFQNNLELAADGIAHKVLPELEKLGPTVMEVVEQFGKLVGWAAGNPMSAVVAALAASVAKAGVEHVVRDGFASLMSKAASAGGGVGAGVLGAAGLALTIGVATIAIESAVLDVKKKVEEGQSKKDFEAINAVTKVNTDIRNGKISQEDVAALEKQKAISDQRIAAAADPTGTVHGLINSAFGTGTGYTGAQQQQLDAKNIIQLKADNARIAAALDRVHAAIAGGIKATITNFPPPVPGVDGAARTGPGK